MADRTVRVILQGDASALVAAARQSQAALRDLANTNLGSIGAGMRAAGTSAREAQSAFDRFKSSIAAQVSIGNLAAQGVTSAFRLIKDGIVDTIKAGADYQTTLNIMGAVSGATADQMAQVSQKARELGKDIAIPGASATDAAKAMTELAKGGFSVADSMTAAKGTLQLAAAAQVDAAKAAEIQVNAMAAYHLGADQASHVADVLANVSNKASGEMTDFAAALTATGATAHSFGISLEDTNTVLGLFANAGIKGEEAGTLMKTMLTKLAAPSGPAQAAMKELGLTVYDASGQFVGMSAVTNQLRAAHENLTQAAYNTDTAIVFGTRGIKGAAILGAQAAGAYDDMSKAINQTGTAEQLAAAKMEGFNGALENLLNQWQDIQLQIFDKIGPGLTDFVSNAAGVLPQIADAALGAVGYIGSKVGDFLGPIIEGAKNLVTQAAPYVLGFASLVKNGVQIALDAIVPFGERLGALFSKAQDSGVFATLGTVLVGLGYAFDGVAYAASGVAWAVGKVVDFFGWLSDPVKTAVIALGTMILLKGPLFAFFDGILLKATQAAFSVAGAAVSIRSSGGIMAFTMDTVKTAAKGMWAALGGWVGIGITALITAFSLFAGSMDASSKAADSAKESIQGFVSALQQSNGVVNDSVRAAAVQAITTAQWGDSQKDLTGYSKTLGLTLTDLTDAMTGVAGKSDMVEAAYNRQKDALQGIIDKGRIKGSQGQVISTAEAQNAMTSLDLLNQQHTAWGALADQASTAGATAKEKNDAIAGSASGAASSTDDLANKQQVLNAAMQAGADPTAAMKTALDDLKSAADQATTAGQFLWATMEQAHGNAITVQQAAELEAAAFRGIGSAATAASDAQINLENAHQKVADAQDKLDKLSSHLGTTLDGQAVSATNLAVTQADVDQASRDLASAQNAEADASRGVSDAADKQTDAALKAAQAGIDAAGAAYAHKAALGDLKGATDDARAATEDARQKFIDAQVQINGGNIPAAEALADKYHLIPDEVVTTFQQNGAETAKQQVKDLNDALDKIKDRTVHYTIVGDASNPGGYQVTAEGTMRATSS